MNNRIVLRQGTDFTFDASAKQITFIGFTPVHARILVAVNVTDNIIIYSSTVPATKGSLSSQVLTLDYDTTSMDDNDNIQITYYDRDYIQPVSASALPLPSGAATSAKQDTEITALQAIQEAVQILDNFISSNRGLVTEDNSAAILAALQSALTVNVNSLPAGLATSANQSSEITLLNAIGALLAGTLTIGGTVTANAGTNLDTSALALEATLQSVKTAVETIDNFISGSKGLVTEDNSAAILAKLSADPSTGAKQDTGNTALAAIQTAVQLIDNFISGSRGLVTEDNSAAILTAAQAIQTAVQIIDNAVSGAGFNITQLGGTNIDTNSGNKSAGTIRSVIATDQPNLTTPLNTKLIPQTSGGLSTYRSIDLDESEEDVKASAGQLFGYYFFNNHATDVRFIKIYDGIASGVTVGSTTPKLTIPIPPKGGANLMGETGIEFTTGICAAATTGVADNDTGAPGANEVIANFFYK